VGTEGRKERTVPSSVSGLDLPERRLVRRVGEMEKGRGTGFKKWTYQIATREMRVVEGSTSSSTSTPSSTIVKKKVGGGAQEEENDEMEEENDEMEEE